jgi:hypothetical protein
MASMCHCCCCCLLLQVMSVFSAWARNIARGAITHMAQQRLWELLTETNTATSTFSNTGAASTAAASGAGWRLFPARGGAWVSLADSPMVADEPDLAALFEGTPGMTFLELPTQHGRWVGCWPGGRSRIVCNHWYPFLVRCFVALLAQSACH